MKRLILAVGITLAMVVSASAQVSVGGGGGGGAACSDCVHYDTAFGTGTVKFGQGITWTGAYPSAVAKTFQMQVGQAPASFNSTSQGYYQIGGSVFASLNQGPQNDPPTEGNGTWSALLAVNQSALTYETIGITGFATANENSTGTWPHAYHHYIVGVDGEAFYEGYGRVHKQVGVLGLAYNIGAGGVGTADMVTGGLFQGVNDSGNTPTFVSGIRAGAVLLRASAPWGASIYADAQQILINETAVSEGVTFDNYAGLYVSLAPSYATNKYAIYTEGGNNVLAAGTLVVNNTAPVASAVLQADSTTQGFLPPRMTTAQRNGISSPAEGLAVYDTDLHKLYVFDGTVWQGAW